MFWIIFSISSNLKPDIRVFFRHFLLTAESDDLSKTIINEKTIS